MLDIAKNPIPLTIFERSATLFKLPQLISEQINLYANQDGHKFQTAPDEIRTFLVLNMMAVCKLSNIKYFWAAGDYMGNNGIKNMMTRSRLSKILLNIPFEKNQIADKSDKSYKLLPAIDLINAAYQAAVSNVDEQAIGKHMTNFKGHHFANKM